MTSIDGSEARLARMPGRLVMRLLRALATWQEERRAIARLRGYSDSQLGDIGAARPEIASAVRNGWPARR